MWEVISAFNQPCSGREPTTLSRTILRGQGSKRLAAPSPTMAIVPRTRNFACGRNRAPILSEPASATTFGTLVGRHVCYLTQSVRGFGKSLERSHLRRFRMAQAEYLV